MRYVLVSFIDGDARVYKKRVATKQKVTAWNNDVITAVRAEIIHEGTDKNALLGIAKLMRHEFAEEHPFENHADHTESDTFL